MRRKRENERDQTELLMGIAQMLMRVDVKLDRVLNLLRGDSGDGEDES
jgi:hypothetical protein